MCSSEATPSLLSSLLPASLLTYVYATCAQSLMSCVSKIHQDVRTAVRVVQLYNPAFGAKRVAQELRQRLQLTVSDKRAKKFMFPVFQHGAICTVGEVFPRSPASAAGLAEDDVIVKIGTLDGGTSHPPQCRTFLNVH